HESGHALVAYMIPGADPVHKVTIIPRGMALGLTQQVPLDDRHTYDKEYLLDMLAILYGGRAAEVLIVGGEAHLVREREQPADLFRGERLLP
ncbi:MAG: hypothetical protein N2439_05940, partial [Anaerolineae bacterium]|nr:hypothetical protein [Anaerolineae bacterium]